jgi:hypothetical protein
MALDGNVITILKLNIAPAFDNFMWSFHAPFLVVWLYSEILSTSLLIYTS